jgi:hypothetical protein
MKQRILLPILLTLALVACGETKKPADTPAPATPASTDTTATADTAGGASTRRPEMSFEDQIVEEYSYAGVDIPKDVADSILRANKSDIRKMEKAMTTYLHRQDTVARRRIAEIHGITIDSVNRILKEKGAKTE